MLKHGPRQVLGKSATLNGVVNANDLSTYVTFEYGTTPGHGTIIAAAPSPVTGNIPASVSADITGLKAGTTYYFRVIAANSHGKTTGINIPFRSRGRSRLLKLMQQQTAHPGQLN